MYLRLTLADLTPTFGATDGAQLLDYYVHDPAATTNSTTAAAYPSRNYTIAPADAWSQRIEVQGFASPVWQNASGDAVGTPTAVVASTLTHTITVALPESEFGTPASGWTFTIALTGQDGFSSDQARAFTATPGGYSFGVCAAGDTGPICSLDPNNGAQGDGHDHPARRLPGDRARPDPRPGRPAGRHRAVKQNTRRQRAVVRFTRRAGDGYAGPYTACSPPPV